MSETKEQKQPIIVFLSIALVLFLGFIGFFAWHTARMRDYELNYIQINGTVVDIEARSTMSAGNHRPRSAYYLVIAYEFDGNKFEFTDREGYEYRHDEWIGESTKVYVNPQNPIQAERVRSAGFVSIICACFFAFFCVTYAAGMNILLSIKGSSFKKRFLFIWGTEILIGIAFLLLFWLGLPNSGFGQVFTRIKGAIGITVVCGLVLLVTLIDGIISWRLHSKK